MSNRSVTGARGPRTRGSSFQSARGFPYRSTWKKPEELKPSASPPPRGQLLIELARVDVSSSSYDPKIRDCSYVASYSWLDGKSPAVIIPGKPPAWAPPTDKHRLEPDHGDYFRDPNPARYPTYPMEAAIQAVLKQSPQFPTQDIDIVTCTSVLGNLSRFARGVDKEFRIILARLGTTIFFLRRENCATELIPNVRGYGHTFPEEYTTWEKDVKGSVSHQRIIQYWFGKLHLLVRCEVDGYMRDEDTSVAPQPGANSSIDALGTPSIGYARTTGQACLQIKTGGHPVAQERIFDLKTRLAFNLQTRTIKKEIDLADIVPRLWISQIPILVVGYHDRGLFEDIRVQDMREEVKTWELDNAENLGRLASLLHELVEAARTSRTNLEVCRSESGPLEIRRLATEGFEALPFHLKNRWIREPNGTKEAPPGEDHRSFEEVCDEGVRCDAAAGTHESRRASDTESPKDYTACSSDVCGYCGLCSY